MKTRQIVPALLLAVMALALVGGEAESRKAKEPKLLARPDAFTTLVNPNCSHCVDEAKRRAADLRDDDRVLAWVRGKYEGGGIPYRFFLVPYRVISDTYGVFVFDPDAGFVRGYEPSLDFTFHGWRNGVMVIRHKDGTLFSSLTGLAFDGPRKGERLTPIATMETNWGHWKEAYPGSVAYHMFDKYQPMELPRKRSADSLSTRLDPDRRLDAEEEVLGLGLDDNSKAWSLASLAKQPILHDKVGDQEVIVLWYEATHTAVAFANELEETNPVMRIDLELDAASPLAPFLDKRTGSHFGVEGRAVDGPLKGKTLRWLPAVQCRWFAWSAEYPQTELLADEAPAAGQQSSNKRQGDAGAAPKDQPSPQPPPGQGVIVEPTSVTRDQATMWREAGLTSVVLVLSEAFDADVYQQAASHLQAEKLDLYYWIEVARNPTLADEHPDWMASLGLHQDWHERFPQVPLPAANEVAKAYPWVPIGYATAYAAHLARVAALLARVPDDYQGLLLNDLQGGPASCGCGNLQCRWALDYGVPETAKKLEGDDVAARFVREVAALAPNKEIIPVWMTECEDKDLPADLLGDAISTGYCGSVPCAQGRCPQEFTAQWQALSSGSETPIALLATHKELARDGSGYGRPAGWIRHVALYLDRVLERQSAAPVSHQRLWMVVQGEALTSDAEAAVRRAAERTHAGAVLVAMVRLDQSYEPRIVRITPR